LRVNKIAWTTVATLLGRTKGLVPFVGEIVGYPVLVKPFPRLNFYSVNEDAEVQVVAAGHAGCAGIADDLPFGHVIANRNTYAAQVRIEALQSEAVVDDNALAVNAELIGEDDGAVVCCRYR